VSPVARRRGIARSLLGEALREAAIAGARRCFLEVRESNAPAIALYSAAGFRIDARRKGYYRSADGPEDALLMSRELSD
ncbi:MAG: GNAT family N-acetyltransferase, partial [Gammaproteobacteria bacterium]